MRVAAVGGIGLVGRCTVQALERDGHEAVVLARSRGVNVASGVGLDRALAGVESVVDVTNTTATDPDAAREFFGTMTEHLLASEQRAVVDKGRVGAREASRGRTRLGSARRGDPQDGERSTSQVHREDALSGAPRPGAQIRVGLP